jgi:hypothetical protein
MTKNTTATATETTTTTMKAPVHLTYTLAYTPKGIPTFFKPAQIIPAGTMLLLADESFVTLPEDYQVKAVTKVELPLHEQLANGFKKLKRQGFVAAAM